MQKHTTATNSAQYNVRCSTIRILEDSRDEKEQRFSADKTYKHNVTPL
jgi:hypothetical protein